MRRLPIIGAILILTLSGAQCGLERTLTAWNPPLFQNRELTKWEFTTRADHNDIDDPTRIFLGYEVYYKIALDQNVFPTELKDASELAPNGFKRLHSSTDRWEPVSVRVPLIENDAAEGTIYTITLEFTPINQPTVDWSGPPPEYELRRSAHDTTPDDNSFFKRFSEFFAGDDDIDPFIIQGLMEDQTVPVYIALYAYAYGKSIASSTLFQDINSPLLYLGANQINIVFSEGLP